MRERVRHFRGELVIESNSSGTRVSATLPLKTPPSTLKEHYAISGSIKT
jgi:signal transduction histidine kinase